VEVAGLGVVAEYDARGVAVAGELGEPNAGDPGEGGRGVEDDQGEKAAPEEAVCGPGAAGRVLGADHDEPVPHPHKGGGCQCAAGIDPGDPGTGAQDPGGHLPKEGGFAAAQRAGDLRDPSAREAAADGVVERGDAGGAGRPRRPGCGPEGVELAPEGLKGRGVGMRQRVHARIKAETSPFG
jgi:hypothetical protein